MYNKKMTYEERLQYERSKLAYRKWRPDRKKDFRYWEEWFRNDAIAIVESQAEAIRSFAHSAFTGSYSSHAAPLTDSFLLEHGYIEPKTIDDESKDNYNNR